MDDVGDRVQDAQWVHLLAYRAAASIAGASESERERGRRARVKSIKCFSAYRRGRRPSSRAADDIT